MELLIKSNTDGDEQEYPSIWLETEIIKFFKKSSTRSY